MYCRNVFKTLLNIFDEAFFKKVFNNQAIWSSNWRVKNIWITLGFKSEIKNAKNMSKIPFFGSFPPTLIFV